jgi:hypothetical protein
MLPPLLLLLQKVETAHGIKRHNEPRHPSDSVTKRPFSLPAAGALIAADAPRR